MQCHPNTNAFRHNLTHGNTYVHIHHYADNDSDTDILTNKDCHPG